MSALSRDQAVALAYLRREGEASESALVWEGLHAPWRTLDALMRRGLVVRGEWLGPVSYTHLTLPTNREV